jgi:hypothetical protein
MPIKAVNENDAGRILVRCPPGVHLESAYSTMGFLPLYTSVIPYCLTWVSMDPMLARVRREGSLSKAWRPPQARMVKGRNRT